MDIEYLKDHCKEKEYIAFVDSADQRLQKVYHEYEYMVKDKYGGFVYSDNQIVKGIDTVANRENFVYDYVVTFQQPFENVVSVEVLEAYIPTAPLREMQQREVEQQNILRYVTVACPEIEQHIKRNKKETDFSFRLCRIGWETLLDKNYLYYRLPFPRRYFHPIGRLGKINLRFLKNNSDTPIEFKGAHHTLLISIISLEPERQQKPEFILNPEYQPNRVPDHFSSMHADDDDEV